VGFFLLQGAAVVYGRPIYLYLTFKVEETTENNVLTWIGHLIGYIITIPNQWGFFAAMFGRVTNGTCFLISMAFIP
jgi:hypothetical protein